MHLWNSDKLLLSNANFQQSIESRNPMQLPEPPLNSLAQSARLAAQILSEQLILNKDAHNSELIDLFNSFWSKLASPKICNENSSVQKHLAEFEVQIKEKQEEQEMFLIYRDLVKGVHNWLRVCPDIVSGNQSSAFPITLNFFQRLPKDTLQLVFSFLSKSELAFLEEVNRFFSKKVAEFKRTSIYTSLPITAGSGALPHLQRHYIYDCRYREHYKDYRGTEPVYVQNLLKKAAEGEGKPDSFADFYSLSVHDIYEIPASKNLIVATQINGNFYLLDQRRKTLTPVLLEPCLDIAVLPEMVIFYNEIDDVYLTAVEEQGPGIIKKRNIFYPTSHKKLTIILLKKDEILIANAVGQVVILKRNSFGNFEIEQTLHEFEPGRRAARAISLNEQELITFRPKTLYFWQRHDNKFINVQIIQLNGNARVIKWSKDSELILYLYKQRLTQILIKNQKNLFEIKQTISHKKGVSDHLLLRTKELLTREESRLTVWRKDSLSQFQPIQEIQEPEEFVSGFLIEHSTGEILSGSQIARIYKRNSAGMFQLMSKIGGIGLSRATTLSDGRLVAHARNFSSLKFLTFTSLVAKLRTLNRPKVNALDLLRSIQTEILFEKTKHFVPNDWRLWFWSGSLVEIKKTGQTVRIPSIMEEILTCITEAKAKVQKLPQADEKTVSDIYRYALQSIAVILIRPICKDYPNPKVRASLYLWRQKIIESRLIFDTAEGDHEKDFLEIACGWRLSSNS